MEIVHFGHLVKRRHFRVQITKIFVQCTLSFNYQGTVLYLQDINYRWRELFRPIGHYSAIMSDAPSYMSCALLSHIHPNCINTLNLLQKEGHDNQTFYFFMVLGSNTVRYYATFNLINFNDNANYRF